MKNREIKFRAWDKRDSIMRQVIAVFMNLVGGITGIHAGKSRSNFAGQRVDSPFIDAEHVVLMQFTGLLDKNGKEIYEGDIVKFRSHPAKMVIAQVIYDNPSARFMVSFEGGWHSFQHYNHLEIIGNVYENPNLIK